MGTVGIVSSSINSSGVYSGGSGGGNWFLRAGGEFFRKFFDKTLRRPRARFAERANGAPGDVVADRLERVRILRHAAAEQHAVR